MDHGCITARAECKVTDDRSHTKLIGAEHETNSYSNKPAERCFPGKTGFKMAQYFFNKIQHDRMVNHQKV